MECLSLSQPTALQIKTSWPPWPETLRCTLLQPAEAVLPEQVDQSVLDKEKEIFVAQARESGKPDNIIEKMVSGRIQKLLKEICVSSQPFVKDPQRTVQQLVDEKAKKLGVELRFNSFAKFNF